MTTEQRIKVDPYYTHEWQKEKNVAPKKCPKNKKIVPVADDSVVDDYRDVTAN